MKRTIRIPAAAACIARVRGDEGDNELRSWPAGRSLVALQLIRNFHPCSKVNAASEASDETGSTGADTTRLLAHTLADPNTYIRIPAAAACIARVRGDEGDNELRSWPAGRSLVALQLIRNFHPCSKVNAASEASDETGSTGADTTRLLAHTLADPNTYIRIPAAAACIARVRGDEGDNGLRSWPAGRSLVALQLIRNFHPCSKVNAASEASDETGSTGADTTRLLAHTLADPNTYI